MTFVRISLYCPQQSNKSRANSNQYDIKHPLCCLRWWRDLGLLRTLNGYRRNKKGKQYILFLPWLRSISLAQVIRLQRERERLIQREIFYGMKAPSRLETFSYPRLCYHTQTHHSQ